MDTFHIEMGLYARLSEPLHHRFRIHLILSMSLSSCNIPKCAMLTMLSYMPAERYIS